MIVSGLPSLVFWLGDQLVALFAGIVGFLGRLVGMPESPSKEKAG